MKLPYQPEALQPLGRILNLAADGWTVWDCAPIFGPAGEVHLFATRWAPTDPTKPDATWYLGSQIVHAVAEQPTGPYTIRDVVLEGNGSARTWDSSAYINPKIYQLRDGRYALIYTGCTAQRHDTQAIGLLVADSLNGPWCKLTTEAPLIASLPDRSGADGYICNNPALLEHPNGQYWLYYKGRNVQSVDANGRPQPGGMRICLAIADQLRGPYHRHPASPVIDLYPKYFEDPYVWHQDGAYWLLANDDNVLINGGLLFRSDDGLHWSEPVVGYPPAVSFTGHKQRLEEPNLLFRDGLPAYLFNVLGACSADSVYSGHVFAIAPA